MTLIRPSISAQLYMCAAAARPQHSAPLLSAAMHAEAAEHSRQSLQADFRQAGASLLRVQAMHQQALWYTQYGLMVGSVFEEILEDLREAGLSQEASVVDQIMYNRTAVGVRFESLGPCPTNPGVLLCRP